MAGKGGDGSLTAPLHNPAGAGGNDGKGSGGSGAGEKENAYDRAVQQIEKRTRAFDNERAAVGRSAQEAAKAEAAFKLMEAAKQAGIPVTQELKDKVDALSNAYATAKVKLQEAKERQQARPRRNPMAKRSISATTTAIPFQLFAQPLDAVR